MKQLFCVRLSNGKLLREHIRGLPNPRWSSKIEAKKERDLHHGATIALGPDHWRYKEDG